MNNKREAHSITWFIENYSYCWHKNGEVLKSPEFTFNGLAGTVWTLHLYPRGVAQSKGYVSLFLTRNNADDGPEEFTLQYHLSVLAADGSDLILVDCKKAFKSGQGFGGIRFVKVDDMFSIKKVNYLPKGTFSVRCKIWTDEQNIQAVTQVIIRTRIGIGQISFLHTIEGFSSLIPNEKKIFQISPLSKYGLALTSNLRFCDDTCCEGKIIAEIILTGTNQTISKYKVSLFDSSGKAIECGETDNRFDVEKKDIRKLPLSLTKQVILKKKSEYLPNDKLSLMCECIFSTGIEFQKIETVFHDLPFVPLNQIDDKDIYAEKLSECPSAMDDFTEICNNRLLSDVELKTKTKSFPAHKIVLCARSSVFRSMLTNDMKEKFSNCIQLDDVEDDTLQQLLLFMYSDKVKNLNWESAIKLYYSGDKYAIEKLRVICSSFLIKTLSPSTASELLLLADTHSDALLKKSVEDFIFKHEKEVYLSDEWNTLVTTNPQLVSEIMLLTFRRKQSS